MALRLFLFLLFFGQIQSILAQEKKDYYYLKNKKTSLIEQKGIYFVKFGTNFNKSDLKQMGIKEEDILYFQNKNSLGAIEKSRDDIDFSFSIIKAADPKFLKGNFYTMPYYLTEKGTHVGISHLFTVKLRSPEDYNKLSSLAEDYGVKIVGKHTYRPLWYTLSCDLGSKGNALDLANIFFESGLFEYSQPDIMQEIEMLSCANGIDDPQFVDQWNLKNTGQNGGLPGADINICPVWDITKGSNDVVIAVLDMGIQTNHPDLTNLTSFSYDVDAGWSPGYCCLPHGMRVAGISGADHNDDGIAGISPNSPLMSITNSNLPSPGIIIKWADAIDIARLNGASVLTCAWRYSENYPEIEEAIENAVLFGRNGKGCVIVSGSGNNDTIPLGYPALFESVLAIGATDRNDTRASTSIFTSSFGNMLDVVAPGVEIPTLNYNANLTPPSDNYWVMNGTSASTSHVSSLAALILSVNNDLTYLEVIDIIRSTAQKVGGYNYVLGQGHDPNYSWNNEMGFGRIDACKAIYKTLESVVNITGPDYLCSTSTFTLQNAPTGSSVTWSVSPTHLFSGSTSGSGASASLSPASWASSGQATVTFSIDGGCGVIESSTEFWVGRAVSSIEGPYDMAVNTVENYFATGNPYMGITDYQWSVFPSGYHWIGNQGTNGITLSFSATGLYSLELDVVNPCGARGSEIGIYVYNPWEHFTLYPNPTSDILHISMDLETRGRGGDQDFEVSLYDGQGRELIPAKLAHQQTSLDLSRIPKGFYYVHIRYRDALLRRQIRVER
ncbi:Por secretion system C-terminal sorting domain-containing protein [Aquiflexum balticum DSM 16537]|uniref:Por secretion system C-terminal sorting domain-containing protein n=1 Tax=Aquiflexum balticum DSM 16537 TaxID=758820 RepID=A0A1W2HAV8_9BACT|nr:S8 family serine peptidase [Aquiflexum balticum]SMD45862.1 Por secretion system C-terminal sorting domain-containing protein [Aquiflexum balticum DSM 16537]